MKLRAIVIAALALMPSATLAQGCGEQRGRLAIIAFKEHTLFECTISPDVATAIVLEGDEMVGPTGAADPDHFNFEASENMLVVQPKPTEINRSPNLSFIGKKKDGGATRNYFFLFKVSSAAGLAAIEFTYGKPATQQAPVAIAATTAQPFYPPDPPQQQLVASRLRTAPFYGINGKGINWAYDCMCASGPDIKPVFSDNGKDTIFDFPDNRDVNVVVARLDRDGTEKAGELPKRQTVVSFTPLLLGPPGPQVIPMVAEYWLISSDKQAVAVKNLAYYPGRSNLGTGTQSPDVVRIVRPTPVPGRTAQK